MDRILLRELPDFHRAALLLSVFIHVNGKCIADTLFYSIWE